MVSLLLLCVAQTSAELEIVQTPIVAAEVTTSAEPDSDVETPAAETSMVSVTLCSQLPLCFSEVPYNTQLLDRLYMHYLFVNISVKRFGACY